MIGMGPSICIPTKLMAYVDAAVLPCPFSCYRWNLDQWIDTHTPRGSASYRQDLDHDTGFPAAHPELFCAGTHCFPIVIMSLEDQEANFKTQFLPCKVHCDK